MRVASDEIVRRVLQRKVPSMDLIPEFVIPEGREGQINLNTSEWLILSKIEKPAAVKAYDAILQVSDGIMVARVLQDARQHVQLNQDTGRFKT